MSQHKHLYNSARWKRRRTAQLAAQPLCAFHLKLAQTVEASVADHVVPHRGDVDLFFNGQLQSLCKPCHDAHKQAQEHNADGILRGAGHDGAPLDQAHHWHRPVTQAAGGQAGEGEGGSKVWSPQPEDRTFPFSRTPAKLGGGA